MVDKMNGDYSQEVGFEQDPAQIKLQVERGEIKASYGYVLLRSIESIIKEIIKDVEQEVVGELTLLDDKEDLVALGHKISHIKGRTSFSFKESPIWKDVNSEKKRVENLIKVATTKNVEVVDKITGEIIEPVTLKHGKGFFKMEKVK